MSSIRIIFLGTSSAIPTSTRGLSSVAVIRDGVVHLFDAGEGIQSSFIQNKIGLNKETHIFITHMHGDHLGDRRLRAVGAGTCANSERVPVPNSMTAEVVVAKNAVLVTTRAMAGFVASEVEDMGGQSLSVCSQPVAATVPVEVACRSSMDVGGMFVAKTADAAQGVEITIVHASHVNNAPPALLSEAQRMTLEANGAVLEYGPPTGYVVKFTNGLTAYLTGDNGNQS